MPFMNLNFSHVTIHMKARAITGDWLYFRMNQWVKLWPLVILRNSKAPDRGEGNASGIIMTLYWNHFHSVNVPNFALLICFHRSPNLNATSLKLQGLYYIYSFFTNKFVSMNVSLQLIVEDFLADYFEESFQCSKIAVIVSIYWKTMVEQGYTWSFSSKHDLTKVFSKLNVIPIVAPNISS